MDLFNIQKVELMDLMIIWWKVDGLYNREYIQIMIDEIRQTIKMNILNWIELD